MKVCANKSWKSMLKSKEMYANKPSYRQKNRNINQTHLLVEQLLLMWGETLLQLNY